MMNMIRLLLLLLVLLLGSGCMLMMPMHGEEGAGMMHQNQHSGAEEDTSE